jgi:hypothetical protein
MPIHMLNFVKSVKYCITVFKEQKLIKINGDIEQFDTNFSTTTCHGFLSFLNVFWEEDLIKCLRFKREVHTQITYNPTTHYILYIGGLKE